MTDFADPRSAEPDLPELNIPDGAAILNALPDPVLVVGADNSILYANNAAEQLFRVSWAYMCERSLADLIPHDSPVLLLVERVRRSESSMSQHGVRLETPRIGEHLVRVDGAPMAGQSGPVVLTIKEQSIAGKIDRTLTHRDSTRSISAMAALLAHEIKNPLSGVRGAAQLLEQSISGDDTQLTRLIIEETDRVVALIDRMEAFTGDTELDNPNTLAAFALGLVLFAVTLVLNVIALRIVQKYREKYE